MEGEGGEEDGRRRSAFGALLDGVRAQCRAAGLWSESMHRDLPKRWEKHGDLVVLPATAFSLPQWRMLGPQLWRTVAEALGATRVCRKHRIDADDFRSPHVDLLRGADGWVVHVDNAVRYHYDVTKCMFSIGNVNEKIRVASFDCASETVVDLFAGIGYFTLPYLVHAKARHVIAIDWNADAIEALHKNLADNAVADRCTVLEGDCRKVCPSGVADRVNAGLLPTARQHWLTACRALKPSGGVLHMHDTVTSSRLLTKQQSMPANAHAEPAAQAPMHVAAPLEDGTAEERTGRRLSRSASLVDEFERRVLPEPRVAAELAAGRWAQTDAAWRRLATDCAATVCRFLNNLHADSAALWQVEIARVGRVKSYAPHVDHVVLDLHCRPLPPAP